MRDRNYILKILDRLDGIKSIFLSEDGIPAFPDQIKKHRLLVFERWLMQMRLNDQIRLDEFIYHTSRRMQRIDKHAPHRKNKKNFRRFLGSFFLWNESINARTKKSAYDSASREIILASSVLFLLEVPFSLVLPSFCSCPNLL